MRAFLKILLWGFAAFMVASVAQEWDFFSSAWFGGGTPEPQLSAQEKRGASEAVYLYLKMTSHLYGSGGDPRFAERTNAAPDLVQETLTEVEYLRRNRRVQDPVLMKLVVLDAQPLGESVEVRTREFWVTRTYWIETERESDPPLSEIVFAKYRLERDGEGFRVMAWDFDEPASDESAAPPATAAAPSLEAAH